MVGLPVDFDSVDLHLDRDDWIAAAQSATGAAEVASSAPTLNRRDPNSTTHGGQKSRFGGETASISR